MKKNNFIVREAAIGDLAQIESLIKHGIATGKLLTRSKKEIKSSINEFYVSVMEGEIVGCCNLKIYSEKIAEIRSLVVKSTYRYKGIGTKLVEKCLEVAKENGIYEILAITEKDDFFSKLGFSDSLDNKKPMILKL